MTTSGYRREEKRLLLSDGKYVAYIHHTPERESDRLPIIYMPGFLRAARDFDRVALRFASERHVVGIDLRGRGQGWRGPDAADYHFDLMVEDVWTLLDHLGFNRVIVIGVALGAFIGWRMASQKPERIAGIVINDSGPSIGGPGGNKMASLAHADELTFEAALALLRDNNDQNFPDFGPTDWDAYTRQVYAQTASGGWVRDFDQLYFKEMSRFATQTPDASDEIAALDAPMLILRGENSKFFSLEAAEALSELSGNATIVSVQARAHPLLLDEPASLASMRTFFTKIEG